MKKIIFILFSVVLVGFAAIAHAGRDEGKAAYNKGDYATAYKEFKAAAVQGDAKAQYDLGLMYQNGQGVSKDYTEAAKWYRKAAEQGDADAQGNLGFMYANGLGVSKDNAEAMKWWSKAAAQGNAVAKNNLSIMLTVQRAPQPAPNYAQTTSQAPSQPTQTAPRPTLTQKDAGKYLAYFNKTIKHDAAGWVENEYVPNSARDLSAWFDKNNGSLIALSAHYTFRDAFCEEGNKVADQNGDRYPYVHNDCNKSGWLTIRLDRKPPCLVYWDDKNTCRPVNEHDDAYKLLQALNNIHSQPSTQTSAGKEQCRSYCDSARYSCQSNNNWEEHFGNSRAAGPFAGLALRNCEGEHGNCVASCNN